MILIEKIYSVEMVLSRPKDIFVYGDNLEHWGKIGQSIIRDCPNTVGIPTKRKPSMMGDAFFSDKIEELNYVIDAFHKIDECISNDRNIVFPENGIGSGLARLSVYSPIILQYINTEINRILKYTT